MAANKEVEYAQAISYIHHMYDTRHKAFHFMLVINAALLAVQFNSKLLASSIERLPISLFGLLVTISLMLFALRNSKATDKYESEAIKIEAELGFSLITSANQKSIGGMHSGIYLTSIYVICSLFWLGYSTYIGLTITA